MRDHCDSIARLLEARRHGEQGGGGLASSQSKSATGGCPRAVYLNCVYHSHWSVKSGRVCDTKVEERENLKESRKVFAYPYFTPSGQKCPAEGIRFELPSCLAYPR